MRRLTTRGREVAQAIARREPFATHGALCGQAGSHTPASSGRLSAADLVEWCTRPLHIVYTVWSYATPIAWVYDDGTVYIVKQKFSRTTSKHQGALYLLKSEVTP